MVHMCVRLLDSACVRAHVPGRCVSATVGSLYPPGGSFTSYILHLTAPRYKPLGPPTRVPRMWGVERDPWTSLGRQGARGDGLVVVFWGVVGGGGGVAARRRGDTRWGGRVCHVSV